MKQTLCILILICHSAILMSQSPINDLCENAIELFIESESLGDQVFDLTGATASTVLNNWQDCSTDLYNDVWFKVEVPYDEYVFIDINTTYYENGSVYTSDLLPLRFEVYAGVCDSLFNLRQLDICQYDRYNGFYPYIGSPSGQSQTIYIRVHNRFGESGKFSISAIEMNESKNNSCEDAELLTVDTNCELENYATIYADPYSWFKFVYPDNVDYVNIQLYQSSLDKVATANLDIYSTDCQNLNLIDTYTNTFTGISISDRTPGEIIYLRVHKKQNSVGLQHFDSDGLAFGICVFEKQNDICQGATELNVGSSNQPILFNNLGSTQSFNPTSSINCGYYPSGYDTWLKTIVPPSGNVTFEFSKYSLRPGFSIEAGFEFYRGDCMSLNPIYCHSANYASTNQTQIIPMTNLVPGETLYIRVMSSFDNDQFEGSAYEEQSYDITCNVDLIKFIQVDPCDSTSNTVRAYFEVHYTADPSSTDLTLLIEENEIPLTSNPQSFFIDVPVIFSEFFHQSTRIRGSCNSNSYLHFGIFDMPPSCFNGVIVNDECIDAIELTPTTNCTNNTEFTYYDASESPYSPPHDFTCNDSTEKDIWFTFTPSSSNDYDLYINRLMGIGFYAYLDVYTGTCQNLTPLSNPTCQNGNNNGNSITLQNLPVNEQVFIRMINCCDNGQGNYKICLIDSCPSDLHIDSPLSIEQYIYRASDEVSGDTSINNSADVEFRGTNSVLLLSGFEVQKHAVFEANLLGCL